MSVHQTGLSGEEMAEKLLTDQGYQLLARRWRGADGEIDLIMRDGEYIVFVEVKSRPRGLPGDGLLAVTPAKQRRMANAALTFLTQMQCLNFPVRFDVVEITRDGMHHLINAFQPGM